MRIFDVMIDFLRNPWSTTPPPADPDRRDARVHALKAHQERVLDDLAATLPPADRAALARLMDDRSFLEHR